MNNKKIETIKVLDHKIKLQRIMAINIAWSYIGKWYKWGGDDPSGFDCSGFVIEILKSIGILPRRYDGTATDLYVFLTNKKRNETLTLNDLVCHAGPGVIVFFYHGGVYRGIGKNVILEHVEFCIDERLSIGASGGSSFQFLIGRIGRNIPEKNVLCVLGFNSL